MTDVDKTQLAISRGARAQALLNDDLLNESFDALKSAYIAGILKTKVEDDRGRLALTMAANQIDKVKEHLWKVLNNGKIAQAEIARLAK